MLSYGPHGSLPHNALKLGRPIAHVASISTRATYIFKFQARPTYEAAVRVLPARGR
jgi:hypothetical protein